MNTTYRQAWLISLVAALGGLLFGFDIAIFSGTIPFIQPHFQLDAAALGWIASSLYVGCMIGALITGWLTKRLGRKRPLIFAAVVFAVSSIMMGLAATSQSLIVWRILAGIGVGGASVLSPLYIAEVSPAAVRGRMVSINQLAIVIGILLAYTSNYLLAPLEGNWRWMFGSGAVPATLFFLGVFFIPESPRWLIRKGHAARGRKVLERLLPPGEVDREMMLISQQASNPVKSAPIQVLFAKGVLPLLVIGVTIAIFQQISGANAVLFYAPIIFEKAGMSISDQLFQQLLIGSVNLLFTLLAMQLVDRVGRKRLMLSGAGLMAFFLALIAYCFYQELFSGYLLSASVLAFIATYAATLAPVTWVLISEIFPAKVRELAVAVSSTMLWVACFALTYAFPVIVDRFSTAQTFLLFACICAVYFVFLWRFVPETKGRSLDEAG
ncbi:sugar porter family MFS transporter [Parapedobacter koreensis]|uniref:MFS transporter, sugar porter (SP) family n=1 Tax=Parapedobacter koreensis TaxID=332977 RepID=A0A1H7SMD1_9SPHI|nr:sugar porter family MFS transporter [Parapedobacter koreensis]SEL72894.1 MFS transporter, sugar porter (SP) family [Parapedobacter koreensis]